MCNHGVDYSLIRRIKDSNEVHKYLAEKEMKAGEIITPEDE